MKNIITINKCILVVTWLCIMGLTACGSSGKKGDQKATTNTEQTAIDNVEESTPAPKTEETNTKDEKPTSSNNDSSAEWDEVLDEYEKYVDSYISLMKKALAGDMDAMTEYADMLSSAESIGEKLSSAQSDMTTKQINRYIAITNKMASAAAGM